MKSIEFEMQHNEFVKLLLESISSVRLGSCM